MIDLTLVTELEDFSEPDPHEEKFDFSSPEHVLIEVVGPHEDDKPKDDWENWSIESCTIIWQANPNVPGAAEYDRCYGGFLDYTIQGLIDPPGEGWFVIENVTGHYSKGDGWTTDDDMEFYFTGVRPATEDEIKQA